MGIGRKRGPGGGGASLNFAVKAYSSEAELLAAVPKENTIGIITTTPITSWFFDAVEPETVADGMVWFPTGTSGAVEFNALKKNGIQVYPLSAKQYAGGAWQHKPAMVYQKNGWRQFAVAPTDGLIAEYTFDEFSGNSIPDTSPNGYDLTITNVTQETGIIGKAAYFAGNGGAVANAKVIPGGMSGFSGLTISFWIKIRTNGGYLLGQHNNYDGFASDISTDGHIWMSTGSNNGGLRLRDSKIFDGQWHHICNVFNYSTSVVQAWVDGEKAESNGCSRYTTSGHNFTIGKQPGYDDNYFNGSLDQIRLYNRSLSDDEVKTLWNGGIGC